MTERLTQLEKLYEAEPSDPFLSYGIALEHVKEGHHARALEWLDKTIELDAFYTYAWFQKGRVLAEMGRTDEAKDVLEQGAARAREAKDEKAAGEIVELLESMGGP